MPEDHEELKNLLLSGRKNTNHRLLRKQVRKDGEIMYAEVMSHMITYKGKESYMILAEDITEKVKLRHELMEEKDLSTERDHESQYRCAGKRKGRNWKRDA